MDCESNQIKDKSMEGGAHPAALAQQLAYAQVRLQEGVVPQARCACSSIQSRPRSRTVCSRYKNLWKKKSGAS